MKLYHRTTADLALHILAHGFRDACGSWGFDPPIVGVWFTSRAVGIEAPGYRGEILIEVDLAVSERELLAFEVVPEVAAGYREFVLPAAVINRHGQLRIFDHVPMPGD